MGVENFGKVVGLVRLNEGADVVNADSLAGLGDRLVGTVDKFKLRIKRLFDGSATEPVVADLKTAREVISEAVLAVLEQEGVVATLYNERNPLGTYANDEFPPGLDLEWLIDASGRPVPKDGFVRFSKLPFGYGIVPQAPESIDMNNLRSLGFRNVVTDAQAIALARKNSAGVWEWSETDIVPDGQHIRNPLTTADQYAQAGFEGIVVRVNEAGEIVIPRLKENALRFQQTCLALGMPPMSVEQFEQSVITTVKANARYLPNAGSADQMYIRPWVAGVGGGVGVSPADTVMFGVQVFPFASYFDPTAMQHIKAEEGVYRAHEGGLGDRKVSGNYGGMAKRMETKATQVPGQSEGTKYADLYFMHPNPEQGNPDVLGENSSANVFGIKIVDGKIKVMTPTLEMKAILPGITRDTVLKIARYFGYEIEESLYTWDDIREWDGAFLSGSAAGIVKLGSMTYGDGVKGMYADGEESTTQASEAFNKIYQALMGIRTNDFSWIPEDDTSELAKELRSYAGVIGNVNEEGIPKRTTNLTR